MKYILNKVFLLFVIVLSFFTIRVYAIEKPTQEFYVNDYANVLSSETKNHIINKSTELYNNDKTQVVVSIVNSLEGLTVEEYALEMFREFGIGDKELNNGILLLLSVGDREVRIEVGYGLEGVINDGKAGRILDNYMIPDLRNSNWDSAIKKGYDAIVNELLNPGMMDTYDNNQVYTSSEDLGVAETAFLSILMAVVSGLIAKLLKIKKSNKIAIGYTALLLIIILLNIDGSISLTLSLVVSLIVFIIFYYLKKNDYTNSSSSGRSSSSWSSSSSRSSSSSSFRSSSRSSSRGGGGSSGGGGASRKF